MSGQPIAAEELADLWGGGDEPDTAGTRQPDLVTLASIEARPVRWLWRNWLPSGMITLLSGDPSAGKTFISLAIAAGLSKGLTPDGERCEPTSTIYVSSENAPAEVLRPRFDSLNGDPSRLHLLHGISLTGENGQKQRSGLTLSNLDIIETAIRRTGARLIVFDPVQSYLGSNVDMHRANEVRPILDGLARIAELMDCSVLLIRHLSKGGGSKGIYRGLGSVDITACARTEWLAGGLPDAPGTRALIQIKNNLGAWPRGRQYEIDESGKFSWLGETNLTAGDLLAEPSRQSDSKFAEAVDWLRATLENGPREQKIIREEAEAAGHSYASTRRAKSALRVRSFRETVRGPWKWALPENSPRGQEGAHEDAQRENLNTFAELNTFEEAQKYEEDQANSFISRRCSNSLLEQVTEHLRGESDFPIAAPPGSGDSWEPGPEVDIDVSFDFGCNVRGEVQ